MILERTCCLVGSLPYRAGWKPVASLPGLAGGEVGKSPLRLEEVLRSMVIR